MQRKTMNTVNQGLQREIAGGGSTTGPTQREVAGGGSRKGGPIGAAPVTAVPPDQLAQLMETYERQRRMAIASGVMAQVPNFDQWAAMNNIPLPQQTTPNDFQFQDRTLPGQMNTGGGAADPAGLFRMPDKPVVAAQAPRPRAAAPAPVAPPPPPPPAPVAPPPTMMDPPEPVDPYGVTPKGPAPIASQPSPTTTTVTPLSASTNSTDRRGSPRPAAGRDRQPTSQYGPGGDMLLAKRQGAARR